jgi:hypothetical protein
MNQRQSAMTVGPEVRDAYNKMEKLEHTAGVVLAASAPGPAAAAAPGRRWRSCGAWRQSIRAGGEFFRRVRLTHQLWQPSQRLELENDPQR